MGTRCLLDIDDLSADELGEILRRALDPNVPRQLLSHQTVALIFEKPSLRTRNSCEAAVVQLGGHPVAIFDAEISLDRRESVEDIARVLSGYYACISARVFAHSKIERMAAFSTVPVVNLLSDDAHPCQALADLLTIQEHFGPNSLDGLELAWVGDANNVFRSLTIGALMMGAHIRVASPAGFGPTFEQLERFSGISTGSFTVVDHPEAAVEGARVVSTDSWYSMGQEAQMLERRAAFRGWTVTQELLSKAADDAVLLHCLPAHRGDEVTDEVIEGPQSLVFRQAHNRMHAYRGLLWWLMEGDQP